MASARKLSNKDRSEQGTAFLNFLQSNGLLKSSSTKDVLRQTFNEQFRNVWQTEHEGPIANFSSNMFQLKKEGKIRTNKSGEVTFCQGKIKRKSVKTRSQPSSPEHAGSPKHESPKGHPIRIAVDQHITARGETSSSSDEHESSPEGSCAAYPGAPAESGLPDGVKKSGGFYVCEMCRVMVHSKKEVNLHLDGKKHSVQKLVYGLKENRYSSYS